jgi:hypothetical protein
MKNAGVGPIRKNIWKKVIHRALNAVIGSCHRQSLMTCKRGKWPSLLGKSAIRGWRPESQHHSDGLSYEICGTSF